MKKLFAILLLTTFSFQAFCQSDKFTEDQTALSFGYGFGTLIGAVFSDISDNTGFKYTSTGPMYLKYEKAVSEKIGFGLNLAYANYDVSYQSQDMNTNILYTESIDYTTYSILARINWHFAESSTIDPYWGFGVGYRDGKFKYSSTDPNGGDDVTLDFNIPFGFEMTIGSRFFFSDKFALYIETGLAKSVLQVGATVRI